MRIPVQAGSPAPLVSEYGLDPTWSPDGQFLVYSGPDVGTTFALKAVGGDGRPRALQGLTLTAGPGASPSCPTGLPWSCCGGRSRTRTSGSDDLETGSERRLTDLGPELVVRDFDVSPTAARSCSIACRRTPTSC